ncbi:MAG: sugar ABC transporter permease [Candidatus Limivicinus sp.]|nr:sugar ABC transporter permease [Candidatus Limivicinus sp.]
MIRVVYLSFFKTNLIHPEKTKFVGFENYIKMFNSNAFSMAMKNTTVYSLVMILAVLLLSLLLAVWLGSKNSPLDRFAQASVFVPHIISMVSVAMIFTQMMEPNFGLFNTILTYLGLPTSRWLQSSDSSMASILLISVWKHIGYYVLIFIAAFQSIPTSITEAAALDNAGRAKTLFKIMIPMISPQIFFVLIVLTIGSFKVFDTIRLTTAGGPNNSTMSIVYYIYERAFTNRDIGVGSAAAVVLMVIVGILTVLYFYALSKKVHYQ